MRIRRWAVIAAPIRGKRHELERFVLARSARRACAAYLGTPTSRLMVPGPDDGWPVPLVEYLVERVA